jgi:hypothetical protein
MTKNLFLIIKLFFFLVFFTNSYAETLSSSQTNTSTDTIQDYTINTGVTLTILNTSPGLKITGSERTFKNYGTILSTEDDESSTNITIKAVGPTDGAYDVKIYNYGTIHQENTSAIFVPNNDDRNSDGIGAYVYNEGTIQSDDVWTIRYHSSDYTKFDNYGTITAPNSQYTFRGYSDNYTTINNYAGALIYAEGSGAISQKWGALSNEMTVNNWGKISAEWDTVTLGDASVLNNYGEIIVQNTSYSSRAAIQIFGDNSTVNLYDGTLLVGTIDAADKSPSGSTLNLDLCSSYYFKVEGTWTVNNISGCGNVVYSGGYAQAVSPLFQSVADEIGVLRTDIINDVYDFAKIKMENNESFALPLKSYSKRERGKSINKFASNINGFAFGYPSENDKIKGHLVFNFLDNSIDLLNQNIEDKTYQAGFFLENLNIKAIFGYHDYNGNRIRLNNLVAAGKEVVKANHKSFSSIIGTQFFTKLNDNSYLKYNLDSSFENFFNSEETSDHVTWKNRTLGQVMGDVTLGWSTLPKNKFKFNPELTLGYRTIIDGKNQKYNFNGYQKNFDGGVQEDFNSKIALLTDYSFKKNTNIHFDASAKKTNSKQETYSLNIGFKSKF